MTKIVKAKKKISRQLGVNLWGDPKGSYEKRNYKPGEHGPTSKARLSGYGLQLRAKQRLKKYYNVIEKTFLRLFKEAKRMKGDTDKNFVGLLESRLDAVVYRANFAPTIFAAKQFVSHKHILVNGKKVNIPSYRVKPGDVIEVKEKSRTVPVILESVQNMEREVPAYLTVDAKNMKATFVSVPSIEEVPYPFQPELSQIIELYSK